MSLTRVTYSMIAANVANVEDFGAVVGGNASTNVSAIQAAIDSLPSTGGTVLINGYYEINATIQLKDNINLIGAGEGCGLYLTPGTNARVIQAIEVSGWRLEGLRFDGSGNTTPSLPVLEIGSSTGAPSGPWSKDYVVRDCVIYGGSYEGLYHEDRSTSPTNGMFDNVTFDACGRNCVSLESGRNINFIGCKFLNTNGFSPQGGIDIEPSAGQTTSQIYVTNCLFRGNTGPNMQINGANWGSGIEVSRIVFTGNVVDNTDGNVGVVVTGAQEVVISDNHITGNGASNGILVTGGDTAGTQYCENVIVSNNTIRGQQTSIIVRNFCAGIKITNNIIITSTVSPFTAIRLIANLDPLTGVQIIGNSCNGNASVGLGIVCYSEDFVISNVLIANNEIIGCSTGLLIGQPANIDTFTVGPNLYASNTVDISPTYYTGLNTTQIKPFPLLAAPPATGYWFVGDTVYNSAPAVGQPQGFVCTVAGTPGTWESMANLV